MFKRFICATLAGLLMCPPLFADSSHRNSIMGTGSRRNTIEFEWVEPSAGSAMNLVPGTDNTNALGTSSLRFSDLQSMTGTFGGAVTHSSTLAQTGNLTMGSAARTIYTPATVQSVAYSTNTISPSATFILIGSTGTITLTGTPTITTTSITTGQFIILASTAASITLQDQATLANSGLSLSAGTVAVTTSTPMALIFNGSVWQQVR